MTTLSECLEELLEGMTKRSIDPPSAEYKIAEIGPRHPLDARGRLRIARSALLTPHEYEPRFRELLAAGIPWINVSCYGIVNGYVIVGIETPEQSSVASSRTSVNYSGPPAKVLAHGWDGSEILCLE
jgi:hypothetical protein